MSPRQILDYLVSTNLCLYTLSSTWAIEIIRRGDITIEMRPRSLCAMHWWFAKMLSAFLLWLFNLFTRMCDYNAGVIDSPVVVTWSHASLCGALYAIVRQLMIWINLNIIQPCSTVYYLCHNWYSLRIDEQVFCSKWNGRI